MMRALQIVIQLSVLAIASVGCNKREASATDAGATELSHAARDAKHESHVQEVATEAGATSPASAGAKNASFTGKYTLRPGSLYIPANKDWASAKFKNDESKWIGGGELTLEIDGAGRVSGRTESGPFGAAIIDGTTDGTTLTATIRRKEPADEGLTGTLVAKIERDTLEGSLNIADANAAAVRVGTVSATKR
jgi:hypothetical protein